MSQVEFTAPAPAQPVEITPIKRLVLVVLDQANVPMTTLDIAAATGLNPTSAQRTINRLYADGLLARARLDGKTHYVPTLRSASNPVAPPASPQAKEQE